MALETGELPDRYADPRQLGRGGMGVIFLAKDRELARKVAIKVLDERFAGSEQLRERFKREALTAARLSGHPHVVTIFDVGEWRGRPFIVMEYLPGGTLADRLRGRRVEPSQALLWLGQAAEALDAAHELGIVHRDIKPANLLFNGEGNLAVADFGIARVVDDTLGGMTAAGTVLGTAGYLAPEQALGDETTSASDRYALGVVAYELLTGKRPFERGSPTAEAAAHVRDPVPQASKQVKGLPPSIDRVFERALAKDPRARYSSGGELVGALRSALEAREATTRLLPVQTSPLPTRNVPPPRRRDRPGWFFPLLLAALAAALTGGILAAYLTTRSGENPGPTTGGPVTVTAKETVGTTVVTTLLTTTAATPSGQVSLDEAVQLTNQAAQLLADEQWQEALKTQRRALGALEGTYADDFRYEAYAYYNMGKALAELGRCEQAVRYLDRSEELQGQRDEIDEARSRCANGG